MQMKMSKPDDMLQCNYLQNVVSYVLSIDTEMIIKQRLKTTLGGILLEFWLAVQLKWCAETEKGSRGHGTQPGQTCHHNSTCQYQHPYPTRAGSHRHGSLSERYKKKKK